MKDLEMEKELQANKSGWVVVNYCHPTTGRETFHEETFSRTRTGAIGKFIDGSQKDWEYWKKKFNFSCVRATQTTLTDTKSK